MRFIHTSDWHLGRIFYGAHLTDDQAHVLDQFVDLVKEQAPDAVLIAGDVFDRAVPPTDAIDLLDQVLTRIAMDLNVPVLMIAGNHDSPERLSFASRLLSKQNVHVVGDITADVYSTCLTDKFGPVQIYSIPYAEPPMVKDRLQEEDIGDHNSAFVKLVERVRRTCDPKKRSMVMTHAFVAGGLQCESERPLSVGGTGQIAASMFKDFDYVALGHLHRPQTAGSESIRYSGSLMKYSFSEADQKKGITIVDMDGEGACKIEQVRLSPRRDVVRVEGYLKDLLSGGSMAKYRDDYLSVKLLDQGAILDAQGQLRKVFPYLMQIEKELPAQDGEVMLRSRDHRARDEMDLFADFVQQVSGRDLSEDELAAFKDVLMSVRLEERVGSP